MKVFELMKQLAAMPAGADVTFERMTTIEEFAENEIIKDPDGAFYIFVANVAEAEYVNDNLVKLYGG